MYRQDKTAIDVPGYDYTYTLKWTAMVVTVPIVRCCDVWCALLVYSVISAWALFVVRSTVQGNARASKVERQREVHAFFVSVFNIKMIWRVTS